MKMNKLSIIAILAISFGFFSCNEEESLSIPQNPNDGLETIAGEQSAQTRMKLYYFKIEASPVTISKDGGTSILNHTVSEYQNFSYPMNLPYVEYTGSAPGFTISGNKVTADPMPPNTERRFIQIRGSAFYGNALSASVTIYQEGTATAAAMIGDTKYIGDKSISLAPGKYNCSVGPIDVPYSRFMTISINGNGVYGNADQYPGYIEVIAGADAIVTLEGIMPYRPTVKLHITAK